MVRLIRLLPLLSLAACAVPIAEPSASPPAAEADRAATPNPPPARQDAPGPAAPGAAYPGPGEPASAARSPVRSVAARAAAPPPPPPETFDRQPIEEVIVRPSSVTGYWRLTASRTIDVDVGLFSGIHIRYGGEARDRNICWLQQTGNRLSALCSSGRALKAAEGSVGDDGVTMRWWVGPANIIFSGKFADAGRIAGGFSGGVAGMSVTGDVPATLTRLSLPDRPPPGDAERPSAVLLGQVWDDVRHGRRTEGRYEGAALKRVAQGLTAAMAADPPETLLYLGQILIRWRKDQRETVQDVYQVETAAGRRLCRIAENGRGQVVDFSCVALP